MSSKHVSSCVNIAVHNQPWALSTVQFSNHKPSNTPPPPLQAAHKQQACLVLCRSSHATTPTTPVRLPKPSTPTTTPICCWLMSSKHVSCSDEIAVQPLKTPNPCAAP